MESEVNSVAGHGQRSQKSAGHDSNPSEHTFERSKARVAPTLEAIPHVRAPERNSFDPQQRMLKSHVRAALRAASITVFFMRFSPAQYKLISWPSGSLR